MGYASYREHHVGYAAQVEVNGALEAIRIVVQTTGGIASPQSEEAEWFRRCRFRPITPATPPPIEARWVMGRFERAKPLTAQPHRLEVTLPLAPIVEFEPGSITGHPEEPEQRQTTRMRLAEQYQLTPAEEAIVGQLLRSQQEPGVATEPVRQPPMAEQASEGGQTGVSAEDPLDVSRHRVTEPEVMVAAGPVRQVMMVEGPLFFKHPQVWKLFANHAADIRRIIARAQHIHDPGMPEDAFGPSLVVTIPGAATQAEVEEEIPIWLAGRRAVWGTDAAFDALITRHVIFAPDPRLVAEAVRKRARDNEKWQGGHLVTYVGDSSEAVQGLQQASLAVRPVLHVRLSAPSADAPTVQSAVRPLQLALASAAEETEAAIPALAERYQATRHADLSLELPDRRIAMSPELAEALRKIEDALRNTKALQSAV